MNKDLADQKILIVDDEPMNIALLTELLEMYGCAEPATTTSALDAIERYRQQDFDLVLLDLSMPEKDGFEVMQAFAEADKIKPARVVVLTGHVGEDVEARVKEHGAAEMLSKPFDLEQLARILGVTG